MIASLRPMLGTYPSGSFIYEWCSELRVPRRHPLDYLIMKIIIHRSLLLFLNALLNFPLLFLGVTDCRVVPKPPRKAFGLRISERFICQLGSLEPVHPTKEWYLSMIMVLAPGIENKMSLVALATS